MNDDIPNDDKQKRIDAIVESLKEDAKRSNKEIRRPKDIANKRKPIREVEGHKDYSGESSPYWEFHESKGSQSDDNTPFEDTLANPDVLSDEQSLYNRPLSDDGELRLRATEIALKSLSPQQKRVLDLIGYEGFTIQAAADAMGIKLATAQVLLNRAREKIQRVYEREKKQLD